MLPRCGQHKPRQQRQQSGEPNGGPVLDSLRGQPGGTHSGPSIPQPPPHHGCQVIGSRGIYFARRCWTFHGSKPGHGTDPIRPPARLLHRHAGRATCRSGPSHGVSLSAPAQLRPGSHCGCSRHMLLLSAATGRLRLSAGLTARSRSIALARQPSPSHWLGALVCFRGHPGDTACSCRGWPPCCELSFA